MQVVSNFSRGLLLLHLDSVSIRVSVMANTSNLPGNFHFRFPSRNLKAITHDFLPNVDRSETKLSELGTQMSILNNTENILNNFNGKVGISAEIVKLHSQQEMVSTQS